MTRYENVPDASEIRNHPDDEIDIMALLATLWTGKWIIILITIIFAAAGGGYSIYKPDIYRASALLAPADGERNGRLGGQIGSLASLAGVNLDENGFDNTVIAKEVLRSRMFLTNFIRRHELEAKLIATKAWNSQYGWIYDYEIYNPETGKWNTDESGESLQPTDWDLVNKFRENHLNISENQDNGMVTVSVFSFSPSAARQWTEWLVSDINEHMRAQDIEEAEASINFLESKLDETTNAGMQQVFYQMIEGKTRTIMLANVQNEYVFKVVDPAVIPQEAVSPDRIMVSILFTITGCIFGGILVILLAFLKSIKYARKA